MTDFDKCFLSKDAKVKIPNIDSDIYLSNGKLTKWEGKKQDVYSPIYYQGGKEKIRIGSYAMMTSEACLETLNSALKAYNFGRGEWPTCGPAKRIAAVEKYVKGLKSKRDEIINLIMWEICKNKAAASKEFDRTITYVEDTIKELKKLENSDSKFDESEGYVAQIRRASIGVVLCSGPFNYPFNETYTTLIPALIMGNTIIMKLPRVGVLCHYPTFELFRDCFPPGVINIISGSGRETLPAIMQTGKVDIFAFIGTSKAADAVQKSHPKPHRLRVCLGLEAKNPAIILEDADLDVTVKQVVQGALGYNGQRCTALKIVFVHEKLSDEFIKKFSAAVDALKMGMPWDEGVEITPLPEPEKPKFLTEVIEDAVSKGAKIVNSRSGVDRTFVAPTVLYPANKSMKIFIEEQFGPVVPVVNFKDVDEVYEYLALSNYGQQAAVFTKGTDIQKLGKLVDVLVNQVCRVNFNTQAQRGPDSFPFTGRKDSAYGTLSVYDALRVFSIRSFVATSTESANTTILQKIIQSNSSNFLRMDHIF